MSGEYVKILKFHSVTYDSLYLVMTVCYHAEAAIKKIKTKYHRQSKRFQMIKAIESGS